MGAAFKQVVTSFTGGIVSPLIGLIFKADFKELKYIAKEGVADATGKVTGEVAILYGEFITNVIDFVIVAFVMFMMIKGINATKKKEEPAPAPACCRNRPASRRQSRRGHRESRYCRANRAGGGPTKVPHKSPKRSVKRPFCGPGVGRRDRPETESRWLWPTSAKSARPKGLQITAPPWFAGAAINALSQSGVCV